MVLSKHGRTRCNELKNRWGESPVPVRLWPSAPLLAMRLPFDFWREQQDVGGNVVLTTILSEKVASHNFTMCTVAQEKIKKRSVNAYRLGRPSRGLISSLSWAKCSS